MSWIETARITTKEIKEKREGTLVVQAAEALAQTIDCEKSELSEKSSIHIKEAARLYQERGWLEIYSSLLDSKIYLVRDSKIKTPDRIILRYAQSELDSLRGLSIDELKVMHEAKKAFGGIISMGKVNA